MYLGSINLTIDFQPTDHENLIIFLFIDILCAVIRLTSCTKYEFHECFLHQNLFEFFKILYNNQSEFPHSKIQPLDAKTQIRIQQMIQYIQKHFSEMITLEDLAASANISRSEAGRCFQKYYADTPMSYLIRYRLQQAQKFLLTSTLSVKEISCQCGFSDSSYFVKIFRKHMKRTPAEYRRVYQLTHQI